MLSVKVNHLLAQLFRRTCNVRGFHSPRVHDRDGLVCSSVYLTTVRFNHRADADTLRQYFDKEINEHKKKGRLPPTFGLTDAKYYDILSRIRSKSDRLAYLRSLMAIINTPPSFAAPHDAGGIHSGFLGPYRILRQPDFVQISTWNYLKAQRLRDNLFLNCSGISSRALAQLIIDLRANFNLLNDPWWPVLLGVSNEGDHEIVDVLRTKYQLHGAHLSTWETTAEPINRRDFTLICANRGEIIYQMDTNENYVVQIDGDVRQCCLGNASVETAKEYRNVVKLQSKTKSFNASKRILTADLFAILASLKMRDLFYKKVSKESDDENYNINRKARSGLISS